MDASSMKADIFLPALAVHMSSRPTIPAPTAKALPPMLTVVTWPPAPTSPPPDPLDDPLRRQGTNTICGYIDGNPGLPATCSAGSHCVLDSNYGVIGCCPDSQKSCTKGVFTACVDGRNSTPQTVADGHIFTCTGAELCYKNMFEGGYSQFGCGTATDLAATVLMTANGIPSAVEWSTVEASFTHRPVPTIPSSPRPILTRASSAVTCSTRIRSITPSDTRPKVTSTSSTHTTTTPSSSAVSTTSEASAAPAAPPANLNTSDDHNEAAIIGGTIGGVAVLIGLIALVMFMLRRGANSKAPDRPTPSPLEPHEKSMQYITPMDGAGCLAMHRRSDSFETDLLPPQRPQRQDDAYGVADSHTPPPGSPRLSEPGASHNPYPPAQGYHYPGQYPAAYARTSLTRSAPVEGDGGPRTREMDDFFRGFHTALGRIGEEDEETASGGSSNHMVVDQANGVNELRHSAGSAYFGDMRPLWQQNRRRSKTLMWV